MWILARSRARRANSGARRQHSICVAARPRCDHDGRGQELRGRQDLLYLARRRKSRLACVTSAAKALRGPASAQTGLSLSLHSQQSSSTNCHVSSRTGGSKEAPSRTTRRWHVFSACFADMARRLHVNSHEALRSATRPICTRKSVNWSLKHVQ